MDIIRTITTRRSPADAFDYLSDFTTTTRWDPGTVRTTRIEGAGGVGTRYHNESRFLGRSTTLNYVVTEHQPPSRFAVRGENRTVIARDTITFTPTADGGTSVTYHAQFTFKGWAKLFAPLAAPAFRQLGDRAEVGLREALSAAPTRLGRES